MADRIRRRHYLVNKSIQYRYAGLIFLFLCINFLVSMIVIYTAGWSQLVEKLAEVYPQGRLLSILEMIYWRMFVGFSIVALFAIASAIVFSHRVAGPLVRIKRCLHKIGDGDFDFYVKLRKHDELKDVANEINVLVNKLKKK